MNDGEKCKLGATLLELFKGVVNDTLGFTTRGTYTPLQKKMREVVEFGVTAANIGTLPVPGDRMHKLLFVIAPTRAAMQEWVARRGASLARTNLLVTSAQLIGHRDYVVVNLMGNMRKACSESLVDVIMDHALRKNCEIITADDEIPLLP